MLIHNSSASESQETSDQIKAFKKNRDGNLYWHLSNTAQENDSTEVNFWSFTDQADSGRYSQNGH